MYTRYVVFSIAVFKFRSRLGERPSSVKALLLLYPKCLLIEIVFVRPFLTSVLGATGIINYVKLRRVLPLGIMEKLLQPVLDNGLCRFGISFLAPTLGLLIALWFSIEDLTFSMGGASVLVFVVGFPLGFVLVSAAIRLFQGPVTE